MQRVFFVEHLKDDGVRGGPWQNDGLRRLHVGRTLAYQLVNIYGLRMAGVFMREIGPVMQHEYILHHRLCRGSRKAGRASAQKRMPRTTNQRYAEDLLRQSGDDAGRRCFRRLSHV